MGSVDRIEDRPTQAVVGGKHEGKSKSVEDLTRCDCRIRSGDGRPGYASSHIDARYRTVSPLALPHRYHGQLHPMVVETRAPRATHVLMPGQRCEVLPKTAHYVHGKDGGPCKFMVLQGVGEYDNVAVGGS